MRAQEMIAHRGPGRPEWASHQPWSIQMTGMGSANARLNRRSVCRFLSPERRVTLTILLILSGLSSIPTPEVQMEAAVSHRVEARISRRPNVLIILTDDQRATDTLRVMPGTRRWFERGGTRFSNAFATWPLCCPSRASILTGRYPHNHGVFSGDSAPSLDPTTLIQRHLKSVGYSTAMVGKYFRHWDLRSRPPVRPLGSVLAVSLFQSDLQRQRDDPISRSVHHRLHRLLVTASTCYV